MSKLNLEIILKELKEELDVVIIEEYPFAKELKRKFRADYFIPFNNSINKGLIIEYNGLNFRNSNKSRHTNALGFIKDTEKLNLATELGYLILQYNTISLKNIDFVKSQIKNIILYNL